MKLLCTLLLAFIAISTSAQVVPGWEWARQAKGILVGASDVAADSFGNIYVTGQFDSTASFGNHIIASIPNANSNNDIFLAKYTAAGDVLWVRRVGPNVGSYPNSIAVDPQGNVFVTGVGASSDSAGGVYLPHDGIYVAKYTPTGDVAWVHQVDAFPYPTRRCIACDAQGNVYLAGAFQGTLGLGGKFIYSNSSKNYFISKFRADGTVAWVWPGGGANHQSGGYVTCSGKFVFFLAEELYTGESFLKKYDTFGWQHLWNAMAVPTAVAGSAADANGNVYVAEEAGYVMKYNISGEQVFRKTFQFLSTSYGLRGVAVDRSSAQNVYVTGYFEKAGPNHMPAVMVDKRTFYSNYEHADFVMQFKNHGELVNAQMVLGEDNDYTEVQAVTVDKLGNVYLAGQAGGNCTMGDQTLVMDPADEVNLYLARLSTTTSVNDVSVTGDGMHVYPNPSTGIVTIDLHNQSCSEIILHDITGRRLRALKIPDAQKQVSLDLGGLTDGVYYLQVMSDAGVTTERVVLRR